MMYEIKFILLYTGYNLFRYENGVRFWTLLFDLYSYLIRSDYFMCPENKVFVNKMMGYEKEVLKMIENRLSFPVVLSNVSPAAVNISTQNFNQQSAKIEIEVTVA
jgi:hypothetical protein